MSGFVARLIRFPGSAPPEGADWRAASEAAVEEHEPTLDELVTFVSSAEERIGDAVQEIVDAIKSYHTLQERVISEMQSRGVKMDMKCFKVCGEHIADEIDKALVQIDEDSAKGRAT